MFKFSFPDTAKYNDYSEKLFDTMIDWYSISYEMSCTNGAKRFNQQQMRLLIMRKLAFKYPYTFGML